MAISIQDLIERPNLLDGDVKNGKKESYAERQEREQDRYYEALGTLIEETPITNPNMNAQHVKELVFHFNKASLTDPSIPMWVVKFKGETHYVNHATFDAPFSTKETPDNPHTKGALKFKNVTVRLEQGEAFVSRQPPE